MFAVEVEVYVYFCRACVLDVVRNHDNSMGPFFFFSNDGTDMIPMIGFFDKLVASQVSDPLMSYALFGVVC